MQGYETYGPLTIFSSFHSPHTGARGALSRSDLPLVQLLSCRPPPLTALHPQVCMFESFVSFRTNLRTTSSVMCLHPPAWWDASFL